MLKRYAQIGLAEDEKTEVLLSIRDMEEPPEDAEVVPHEAEEIEDDQPAGDGAGELAAAADTRVVRYKTEVRGGVKLLPNGRRSLRPLTFDPPELEWWRVIVGESYLIEADQVTTVYDIGTVPLSVAKTRRKDEVTALYQAKLAAGFEHPVGSGRSVQIDDKSRANIDAVGQEARWAKQGTVSWSPSMVWRMLDNKPFPLPTPQDMIDLGEAAKTAFIHVRFKHWEHKDAIDAMEEVQEIVGYDISAGW